MTPRNFLTRAEIEAMREPGKPEGQINPWPIAITLALVLWLAIEIVEWVTP